MPLATGLQVGFCNEQKRAFNLINGLFVEFLLV
jgi:hypothetical protein